MCLAIPVRLVEVDDMKGVVELSGARRTVGLQLLDGAEAGDYVLLHAGFAIQKLDETEALKTLELWDEIAERSGISRDSDESGG